MAKPLTTRIAKIAAPDGKRRPQVGAVARHTQQPGTVATERARLVAAQAERAERINATEAALLIPADKVEAAWRDIVVTIRSGVLAVPARVAAAHPGQPEVIATLERELLAALITISDDL